jgi:hypothetical protein
MTGHQRSSVTFLMGKRCSVKSVATEPSCFVCANNHQSVHFQRRRNYAYEQHRISVATRTHGSDKDRLGASELEPHPMDGLNQEKKQNNKYAADPATCGCKNSKLVKNRQL